MNNAFFNTDLAFGKVHFTENCSRVRATHSLLFNHRVFQKSYMMYQQCRGDGFADENSVNTL